MYFIDQASRASESVPLWGSGKQLSQTVRQLPVNLRCLMLSKLSLLLGRRQMVKDFLGSSPNLASLLSMHSFWSGSIPLFFFFTVYGSNPQFWRATILPLHQWSSVKMISLIKVRTDVLILYVYSYVSLIMHFSIWEKYVEILLSWDRKEKMTCGLSGILYYLVWVSFTHLIGKKRNMWVGDSMKITCLHRYVDWSRAVVIVVV